MIHCNSLGQYHRIYGIILATFKYGQRQLAVMKNYFYFYFTSPTLYEQCVAMGSLMSHRIYICKGCETGPTVYRPYRRRLESLTVCRCLYKGGTFSSVI